MIPALVLMASAHSFTVVCQLGKCPTRGAGAGGGGATSRLWPEVGLNTVITRENITREWGHGEYVLVEYADD